MSDLLLIYTGCIERIQGKATSGTVINSLPLEDHRILMRTSAFRGKGSSEIIEKCRLQADYLKRVLATRGFDAKLCYWFGLLPSFFDILPIQKYEQKNITPPELLPIDSFLTIIDLN